jgi:hypothetical protein
MAGAVPFKGGMPDVLRDHPRSRNDFVTMATRKAKLK